MSFVKLQPENFDTFSLTLRPRAEFVSSSSGITGSVRLIERPSSYLKEEIAIGTERIAEFREGTSTLDLVETIRNSMITRPTERDFASRVYLNLVNALSVSRKNDIVIPVQRITQSINFDRNSFTKSTIKNILMPQYRSVYTDCDYSYKNYHTINFFTASSVPSDSAIIYPNVNDQYTLTDAFSFDFYINPRYLTEAGSTFDAGTVLHMSSSLCVSLLTGSHRNADGQVDQFRLAVGLKHSANVSPKSINVTQENGSRSFPQDLVFVSDDNCLKHNNWHHVSIRWGSSYNNRTGSMTVDSTTTLFYYPSSSIADAVNPDVVIVGNQYIGSDNTEKFFNSVVQYSEGLVQLDAGTTDPVGFTFASPLNAELHDLKLFNRVLTNSEVEYYRNSGPDLNVPGLVFYVPPYFTNGSIKTQDCFPAPTFKATRAPYTPFDVNLAFQAQVFSPNLQNFLVDLVNKDTSQPRLYNLTSSADLNIADLYAVDHMFRSGSFIKRAYTILPCDNGLFVPNFSIIPTASAGTTTFPTNYTPYIDYVGITDTTSISLSKLVITSSTSQGEQTVDIIDRTFFMSPANYLLDTTALPKQGEALNAGDLTVLLSFSGSNKDKPDTSSNLSTIYQISNLYYGNQIFPQSFSLSSTSLTGSDGKIDITLKDNGFGGLYRADAITPPPTWATVGNLFYDEGLAIIKSPHLYYFGKDNFSVSFNGHQNIHTYTIDAICPGGEINSSSNPSYLSFPPTNEQNETADNFVYITGINIHDDNFNVIMRANLAQPVLKRPDEEFLFRLKYDM